ncbi:unnamed protein product [Effrenium voratum]|nr:unnamed protein product [Effrenium voratum]
MCQGCSDPYKLNGQACTVSCSDMPAPAAKPGMPDSAMAYNGMTWPSLCFDEDEIHFFTVGDWGGVCSWTDGKCTDSSNPYAAKQPDLKGKPWPMPNRHGAPLQEPIDWMAQGLVADRMKEKVAELKKEGKAPKFILNVGDNFYPGGVDTHCDNGSPHDAVFTQSQFSQIFEQVYPVEDLGNIEWWSVLGNHDYGGVCYIKGWDQQIFYTFKPDGRWVMPAQYWHRKVQFQTFSVDFWFLDTNILDTQNPADNPDHNLCSARSNPGLHCENTRYPASNGSDPATCSATGPTSPDDCVKWFEKLWADQKTWFTAAVAKSDADWQIVVMHHPPSYTPGRGASVLHWADIARSAGIDLIVSGHKHEQKAGGCAFPQIFLTCRAMVAEANAEQMLARQRDEVIGSLEKWCQALKELDASTQAQLRDALFVEICSTMSFPGAAALSKSQATRGSKSAPLASPLKATSVATPRAPVAPSKPAATPPKSTPRARLLSRESTRESLRESLSRAVPTALTPRKPVVRATTARQPEPQFQMPAFAGVRRVSSPRNSQVTPLATPRTRSNSLRTSCRTELRREPTDTANSEFARARVST